MTRRNHLAEGAALLAVVLLAGWLRFGHVGVNSFAFDEARLSLLALETAHGDIATVGMQSSAGAPNMPAAAWIFALPYAFSDDPLVATWFAGLLSLGAVIGVWALARTWGRAAGIVAAAYLALNPFAVLYARSVWAQNLLIPLAVAWLGAAYVATCVNRTPPLNPLPVNGGGTSPPNRTITDSPSLHAERGAGGEVEMSNQRRRHNVAIGLAVFLAGFAPQAHFAAAALILPTAYAFFRWRWWHHWRAVLVGGGLAVLAGLPFLLTPGTVSALLSAAGGPSTTDLTSVRDALSLTTVTATNWPFGFGWTFLLLGDNHDFAHRFPLGAIPVAVGVLALLVIRARGKSPLAELSLVLLIAAPLLFLRHSTDVHVHYQLTSVAAAAITVGAGTRLPGRWLTVGVLGVAGVLWVHQLNTVLAFVGENRTPGGIATPLGQVRAVAQTVDVPVIFHAHGDDPANEGEPAVFTALWWGDEAARVVDGRRVLVLPPYPANILLSERPFQAWEEMRASDLLVDTVELPRRAESEPFQWVHYDGETRPAGFVWLDAPVVFGHGARLEAWRVYGVGPRTRLSTLWTAPEFTPGDNVQQFHHLRDETTLSGDALMIADMSVRGHTWRAGDTVIVMGDFFDVPPGEYYADIGHYTLPDLSRIPHTEGDTVRLGPFIVE